MGAGGLGSRFKVDEYFAGIGDLGLDGGLQPGTQVVGHGHRVGAVHASFQADEEFPLDLAHLDIVRIREVG